MLVKFIQQTLVNHNKKWPRIDVCRKTEKNDVGRGSGVESILTTESRVSIPGDGESILEY